MATITPTTSFDNGALQVTWTGVSTADTMVAYELPNGAAEFASMQATGTWGSSTVTLGFSEDGTTYITGKDRSNTAISGTANYRAEISTAAKYVKPASSGGTADNVDVVLTLRG